jgi:transposase-like protein
MQPILYARHQFPPAVIQQTVRFYMRFTLSYRNVEDLLAERRFSQKPPFFETPSRTLRGSFH